MDSIEERLNRYVGPRRNARRAEMRPARRFRHALWNWNDCVGCYYRSHWAASFWRRHRDAILAAVAVALVLGLMILDAVWQ